MSMPQIDPSIYDLLLSQGNQSGLLDPEIERQQKIAEYLRKTMGGPPQSRMSGRIASAPGWVEMLGGLANQGVAAGKDREVVDMRKRQEDLRYQQAQRVLDYLKSQGGQQKPDDQIPIPPGQMVNPRGY